MTCGLPNNQRIKKGSNNNKTAIYRAAQADQRASNKPAGAATSRLKTRSDKPRPPRGRRPYRSQREEKWTSNVSENSSGVHRHDGSCRCGVRSGLSRQADYLDRPVAGRRATDVTMRSMAEAAAKHLGQPIVIENKAGGGGTSARRRWLRVKPDGYTLAQMPITVYRLPLMQKTTWKADRFHLHHPSDRLCVRAFRQCRYAVQEVGRRDRLREGESRQDHLRLTGSGTSLHLGMEMLAEKSGVKFTHVPFKGAAEVNAAVAGGHMMLGASGTSIEAAGGRRQGSASSTCGPRSASSSCPISRHCRISATPT